MGTVPKMTRVINQEYTNATRMEKPKPKKVSISPPTRVPVACEIKIDKHHLINSSCTCRYQNNNTFVFTLILHIYYVILIHCRCLTCNTLVDLICYSCLTCNHAVMPTNLNTRCLSTYNNISTE